MAPSYRSTDWVVASAPFSKGGVNLAKVEIVPLRFGGCSDVWPETSPTITTKRQQLRNTELKFIGFQIFYFCDALQL
jgi:hypothetical protein